MQLDCGVQLAELVCRGSCELAEAEAVLQQWRRADAGGVGGRITTVQYQYYSIGSGEYTVRPIGGWVCGGRNSYNSSRGVRRRRS